MVEFVIVCVDVVVNMDAGVAVCDKVKVSVRVCVEVDVWVDVIVNVGNGIGVSTGDCAGSADVFGIDVSVGNRSGVGIIASSASDCGRLMYLLDWLIKSQTMAPEAQIRVIKLTSISGKYFLLSVERILFSLFIMYPPAPFIVQGVVCWC